ncbi:MAG: acylneuraminate cytidylyltransferase family protein [Pseudomonadota bacterium]|nr:acylneuraminate cytidylyltransferase family protein [Pseudomonadota bacterium]
MRIFYQNVIGTFRKGLHIKKKQNFLGLILARGGSKGIPRKNIKILSGKPLLEYTAEAALKSKKLTRVILSTEDDEIKKIGLDIGLEVPFDRPKHLAKDSTSSLEVVIDIVSKLKKIENYIPDFIVLLQPTSPFRTTKHVDDAINKFMLSDCDSLVSVLEIPHSMSPSSAMELTDEYLYPLKEINESTQLRQNKKKYYARNGAIYIFKNECLKNKTLYGKKIIPYIMDRQSSLDIDDNYDWRLAEINLRNENT